MEQQWGAFVHPTEDLSMHCPLVRASCAVLALAALSAVASAQTIALRASLDGAQTVPSNGSPATGTASMTVVAQWLTIDLTLNGLTGAETEAHIHGPALAGANGPIKMILPLGNKKIGNFIVPFADVGNLLDGKMYIDIHSSAFPACEIRGQIHRDNGVHVMKATLDGFQEVPANASTGTGTLNASIDTVANQLTYHMTFTGLGAPETDAHIHGPAPLSANAGVKHALPLGNTKTGVWNYAESDEADIVAGLMYVNIHSAAFPAGQIRGQILPWTTNANSYCQAKVTSLGCTPAISGSGAPSASAGSGFAVSTQPVPGGSVGIFFYSTTALPGVSTPPFQGGFLCMSGSILRTPGQGSGGTFGVCDGAYGIDFNAFVAGGSDPTLVAGQLVYMQTWFRDPPASFGAGLSNALKFELLP
jgi:hypothetical protein